MEESVEQLETDVPGLDTVLSGGLPRGSLVLVGGPPGAGKTILVTQIGFNQARKGSRVLMLTALSEATAKLMAYLEGLSFFEADRVGTDLQILNIQKLLSEEGLEATLAEIRSSVIENNIGLLIIDSYRSIQALTGDEVGTQAFVFGLGSAMFMLGCTTILVEDQYGPDTAVSPQLAISDTVLLLETIRTYRKTSRRLEVVKMRGVAQLAGRHSYDIDEQGVSVYPRIESLSVDLPPLPADNRLGWGAKGLDELTGGGLPRQNSTLLLGSAGIGKTTLCLQFVREGIANGERCLYLTSYETQQQLLQKQAQFGMGLEAAVENGNLQLMPIMPENADMDKVLHQLMARVRDGKVHRVVIDSIDYMERELAREGRLLDVIASLARFLQSWGATTLITRELPQVVGQTVDLSTGAESPWAPLDNMLLMRPVEIEGRIDRVLSVLKMRNSAHASALYHFHIGADGVEIGGAMEGMQGLLTGLPYRAS